MEIRLTKEDLCDRFKNLPVEKIKLEHFKFSSRIFQYASQIFYFDKGLKTILKDRFDLGWNKYE